MIFHRGIFPHEMESNKKIVEGSMDDERWDGWFKILSEEDIKAVLIEDFGDTVEGTLITLKENA